MINKNVRMEKFIKTSCFFICGLLCLVFLFLNVASIISTSVIDPSRFAEEHILYSYDNIIVNILSVALFFLLLKLLKPYAGCLNPRIATFLLLLYTTLLGTVWAIAVKSIPAADSGVIIHAAESFAAGNYSPLQSADSYFRYYPFQLSFTFICQLLVKIFGSGNYIALGIINVLCLDAAYMALIHLARLIFNNKKIELLTIILLGGCLQPLLFTTFIYGNLPGLAFALWAVVCELLYIQTAKKHWMLLASVWIAMAVTAKPNYLIVLVAMGIVLLLDFLKTRRTVHLLGLLCSVALTLGCGQWILSGYESRAGVDLGKGAPQILWTAMGLQESSRAPGWYNGYTLNTFKKNNFDSASASRQAREDIQERLSYFWAHPGEALAFFIDKTLSQWNEPTYESLWVSQVKKHQAPVPSFVENLYTGKGGKYLQIYLNFYQQLLFIGFFIALFTRLKKLDLSFCFLPLVILGGFFYHLMNEGKSQYILIYFIMLVPYAAYGLSAASSDWNGRVFPSRPKTDTAADTLNRQGDGSAA